MISHELAQQLKDAGFPQDIPEWRSGPDIGLVDDTQKPNMTADEIEATFVYDPTLSELIDACGEHFFALSAPIERKGYENWVASGGTKMQKGPTPEEAVAKLYLALNEKI